TGELQSVSAQTAREIDLWVKERLYELRVFASSYEVSENLDRIRHAGGERAHERLTGYLRSVRERFADYQELLVVNPEGEELASTAPQPTAVELPPGWTTTIRADNAVVGDASWDAEHMKSVVVFAVPIYQTGGRLLGALTAKLDLGALHRLLRPLPRGGAPTGLGGAGGGPGGRSLPPGDTAPQRDRGHRGRVARGGGAVRVLPGAVDYAAARPSDGGGHEGGRGRPRRALARGGRRRARLCHRGIQRHGGTAAREPEGARTAVRHR